jgi:predicted ATPase
MLRRIKVSGFKSLVDFDLEFRPGLNVLIGPNGSGKTNIINFIEFLSFVARQSLLDAVGRSGGAGRIFRRTQSGSLTGLISFSVFGEGEYFGFIRPRQREWAAYELSAEIVLSDNNSSLYYRRQRLKLAFDRDLFSNSDWHIDIEVSAAPDCVPVVTFHKIDPLYLNLAHRPPFRQAPSEDTAQIKANIEQFMSEHSRTRSIHQIFENFSRTPRIVTSDFVGAESFNISPAIVRVPEDIASEPVIAQDGRGLAATLFALQNARPPDRFGYFFDRFFSSEPSMMMKKIISYSRIVNDSIRDINVSPDPVEAKLRIHLTIDYEKFSLSIPFSLVSDGTAKWFTLVTAVVTSSSVFVIEEPENFLHPLMQKEIVRIIRSTFTPEGGALLAIMTTHSETVLNSMDPEEMILIHMEQGRTLAKRPSNSDDIREEIKSTGFGAGYYYIAGAIE